MGTQRVTDDLDRLLELLPDGVQKQLQPEEARQRVELKYSLVVLSEL